MKPSPRTYPQGLRAHETGGATLFDQDETAVALSVDRPKWHYMGSSSTTAPVHSPHRGSGSNPDSAEPPVVSDIDSLGHVEQHRNSPAHVDGKEVDTECSRKPSLYLMFVLLGCTSLICWNFVIQTLPFILLQKLNRPELNNLFLGLYQVANLFMQLILIFMARPQPLLVVFASLGSGVLGLMMATAAALTPTENLGVEQDMDVHLRGGSSVEKDPMNYAQQCLFGVMLLLSILMGCCQGLIQGVGYTLSCHIPPGYVASVSLGQGAAGLLVFCISTISCFFFFDVNTSNGLIQFCFMSFGIVAATAFAFAVFFLFRARRPDIAESVARVSHLRQQASSGDKRLDSPLAESRGRTWGFQLWDRKVRQQNKQRGKWLWLRVFLASWKELGLAVFHFAYTYHLYPSVGPLGWKYSWTFPNQIVVLYGVWFLFETIGRAAPDLGWIRGLGWLRPSRRAYGPLSLSTLIFLAPFLLGYLSKPGTFVTDPIWYMFVMSSFAFCHGWIGTLAFFYACNAVDDPRERMVAGPLTVLSVGFGCVLGFLSSLAY